MILNEKQKRPTERLKYYFDLFILCLYSDGAPWTRKRIKEIDLRAKKVSPLISQTGHFLSSLAPDSY